MNHHELPHGIRLQRPAWWRPGEAIDRTLTHEELARIKTPRAAPATPAAAPVEDEPSGSASKRRKVHVEPHRPRLVPRHAGPVEDRAAMGHAAVLVRGPAPVPRDVRRHRQEHSLPLEAERSTSSAAWQEDFADASRHDAAERAHHESHRRPVLERGHDPRLGARVARRRGARRASLLLLGDESLAWHAPEPQEARQVLEGAPQPCSARGQHAPALHQTVLAHGQARRRPRREHRRDLVPPPPGASDGAAAA